MMAEGSGENDIQVLLGLIPNIQFRYQYLAPVQRPQVGMMTTGSSMVALVSRMEGSSEFWCLVLKSERKFADIVQRREHRQPSNQLLAAKGQDALGQMTMPFNDCCRACGHVEAMIDQWVPARPIVGGWQRLAPIAADNPLDIGGHAYYIPSDGP